MERIGVASGLKYFGTIDWYKDGSNYLVKQPEDHGAMGFQAKSVDPTCNCDTAWGLLFLVRGRAPVVMNKLQYEINMHGDKPRIANWNERPRDAANVAKWIGKQLEQPCLNWQIVNLKVPVDDLHDAPILYIAGNQPLDFTDDEINKLRQYVEDGGLIYANADCGSPVFTVSMKKVCHKLFPITNSRDLAAGQPHLHQRAISPRQMADTAHAWKP